MTIYNDTYFKNKIEDVIDKYASKVGIEYLRESTTDKYTFLDIQSMMKNIREKIESVGIRKGDRVALAVSHSPWAVVVGITLAAMGVTSVLIDASLPVPEIKNLIGFADVQTIITTDTLCSRLREIENYEVPCFVLNEMGEVILQNAESIEKNSVKNAVDAEPDVIAILFSSGTTDRMKGIKITYKSVILARDIFAELSGLQSHMTYLLVLPFNHIAGFTGAMTYFMTGCTLGFIENVNASKLQEGLLRFEPYYFAMVPKVFEVMEEKIRAKIREKGRVAEALVNGLLRMSGFFRKNFGINLGKPLFKSIRAQIFGKNIFGIGVGATPCKASTAEFFLNMGLEWANLYATTEAGVPITATGVLDRYPVGTVGNVNHHSKIKVRIANPDEKGVGEIQVDTEMIMKGYFREPELTKEAFEGEWFKTGDYGYIDKKGYLFIVGRVKESIVLKSGKKVSPIDVDEYYQTRMPQYGMACCGVPAGEGSFDEIHMFVEGKNNTLAEDDVARRIMRYSNEAEEMYQISKIHLIDKLPMTTVGKVRRFKLKDFVSTNEEKDLLDTEREPSVMENSVEEGVKKVLAGALKNEVLYIKTEQSLKEDLGIDSLTMFEICTELGKTYGVLLAEGLDKVQTVGDLVKLIESGLTVSDSSEKIDKFQFPKRRKKHDYNKLRNFNKISNRLYDIQIYGKEKLPQKNNYIICMNHACNLDGLWLLGSLCDSKESLSEFAYMAATHTNKGLIGKRLFRIIGGIPVDRFGNPVPSYMCAIDWLQQGRNLIIHPEGARSRDGSLLPFKEGAAKLAVDTDTVIVPVRIDGSFEIFPRTRKLPHVFRLHGGKYPIRIIVGDSIHPQGYEVYDLTEHIRNKIEEMGK